MEMVVVGVGEWSKWWGKQGLFEEPFNDVFLLAWSEVRKVCMGIFLPLFLAMKTLLVCIPEGTTLVSCCCIVLTLCEGCEICSGKIVRSRRDKGDR